MTPPARVEPGGARWSFCSAEVMVSSDAPIPDPFGRPLTREQCLTGVTVTAYESPRDAARRKMREGAP